MAIVAFMRFYNPIKDFTHEKIEIPIAETKTLSLETEMFTNLYETRCW
jgi:hypothetical protein